jgi:rhodanese-related sulfurtransferase
VKQLLREALLVGTAGVLVAFAANALSPRGLKLSRNYSPGGALAGSRMPGSGSNSNGSPSTEILAQQFRAEGLQLADSNLVAKLFGTVGNGQSQVVFVDARDDEHYQAGHIPGAFQLDHYHPEPYLPAVLPVCQVAEKIIVYCKGGSCEDSEQTAIFLRDAGVPKERLFVYAGGFDEWTSNHMPVQTGQREGGPPPTPAPESAK